MIKRDSATERQIQAADPRGSTWLAANAGSGKTRVLTDRVARLLLEGVQPQHILCLTYTKAAASEMQNRLFKRLGEWAMMDADSLDEKLNLLGFDRAITDDVLREARTLFARAIETPGGLKIQTIHSFCASLLRRFPLEAGVSPQFQEIEDRAALNLQHDVVQILSDGPQMPLVKSLSRYVTDGDFSDLNRAITNHRAAFLTKPTQAQIYDLFEVPKGYDDDALLNDVFMGDENELLDQFRALLATSGGSTDQGNLVKLSGVSGRSLNTLQTLESVFLYGDSAKTPFGAKIGAIPTKAVRESAPKLMTKIEALMLRVEDARHKRIALFAARRTIALHDYAHAFLETYAAEKQARGWLDFDDLIIKARDLLTDPAVAAWVLFRLDGGIDHILVDEAQDTSPIQWNVIELLAQEFTSGEGARPNTQRTLFVVGDKKQSIYSFQGADPREFDRMKDDFSHRFQQAHLPFQPMEMEFSFRSSHAILSLVDKVFETSAKSGFSTQSRHRAFKEKMPGRVDIWPAIEKAKQPDDGKWYDPVDQVGRQNENVLLAERIATEIRRMIDDQVRLPIEIDNTGTHITRPVREGDFLILVQKRKDLFTEIIRACKSKNLSIAGADKLKVATELAVKDLLSLLSFLALPEDDLSLAEALKSPLFGWDEQRLFDLAHGRDKTYLWQAMRAKPDVFAAELAVLNDLRNAADFLRPYDLIERILIRHNGRKKLLSRLGQEAQDGMDAFLSQALSYEATEIPSLTGFLVWLENDDLEIKRQMDSASNQIRVMTVHGAKGLEAPIVILPDTANYVSKNNAKILLQQDVPVWKCNKAEMPEPMRKASQQMADLQTAERDRLLYVAMTRAEKWLIIAAAGDLGKDGQSWYERIRAAAQSMGALDHDFGFGIGMRLAHETWALEAAPDSADETAVNISLPDWINLPVIRPVGKTATLSPSNLGGAKALAGEDGQDEDAALSYGSLVHKLLEVLPNIPLDHRRAHAASIVPDEMLEAVYQEATGVIDAAHLNHLFVDNSLSEVSITAMLGQNRMHGSIDRLIVTDNAVLAVDFKTNAVVPDTPSQCPEGILRQLGAYAHALRQVYPNHDIQTAVLWTRTKTLMTLPHDIVGAALSATSYLDDGKADT